MLVVSAMLYPLKQGQHCLVQLSLTLIADHAKPPLQVPCTGFLACPQLQHLCWGGEAGEVLEAHCKFGASYMCVLHVAQWQASMLLQRPRPRLTYVPTSVTRDLCDSVTSCHDALGLLLVLLPSVHAVEVARLPTDT